MGGEGGTLAVKRAYLARGGGGGGEAAREQAAMRGEAAAADRRRRARRCALSDAPLRAPVVACPLGNLYNKEAVLERLLAKAPLGAAFAHLRLKALVPCELTANPAAASAAPAAEDGPAPFVCPITRDELDGRQPFCVLRPSGRVVSRRAMREVPDCAAGQTALPLLPAPAERDALRAALPAKAKAKAKDKARARAKDSDNAKGGDEVKITDNDTAMAAGSATATATAGATAPPSRAGMSSSSSSPDGAKRRAGATDHAGSKRRRPA